MKRLIGVLFLLIGAPLLGIGVFMIGWGVLALIFDHHSEMWVLNSLPIVFGSVPAAIGFVLCLVSWASIQESRTGSDLKQRSPAPKWSPGTRFWQVLAVGIVAEVAILVLIGILGLLTSESPASVATSDATGVTANQATLNGELTDLNDAAGGADVSFLWGPRSDYYPNQTEAEARDTEGPFSSEITGLVSNTTYYYMAMVDSGDCGSTFGAERSFTTL